MKKASETVGLPPGTPVHVGKRRAERVRITVIDYDEARVEEKEVKSVEECFPFRDKPSVTWINVDGLHDLEVMEKIGTHFGLHPLVLEGIVNTEQRPKMEDFTNCIFVVLKMLYIEEENDEVAVEQVSLILGSNFVISFQEREGDVFEHIRERIRTAKGRIRKTGSDYLAYCLVDAIVDNYFLVLEKLSDKVELLEDELLPNPKPETLPAIQRLKRSLISLRRSVWPLREVVNSVERGDSALIKKATRLYLRDVYDHTIQVIDTIEALRDTVAGILDIYLSSMSNKMNEVMKVLTLVATIFIPLTFIAGIYGMNFKYMPELEWRFGYAVVWIVIGVVVVSMLFHFKRKKWL
ncbi:magnesium/cobalt transporter CorA [bacterium]|nr:magnesium/cobalt transporter CorA [bacterium]